MECRMDHIVLNVETVAPYLFNALPMRIMVRSDQAAQARELLRNIQLSCAYGTRNGHEDEDDAQGS